MKQRLWWAGLAAALAISGCTGETGFPEATGEGAVRAINAIESSPTIAYLVEERTLGGIDYKSASGLEDWDDLSYTFNFEVILAGDSSRTRVASQFIDVTADTEYTMLLSGDLAAPDVTLWEAPEPEFGEGATEFEARFGHIASSQPALDVYFGAPGVAPVAGQAIGTLAFRDQLAPLRFEDGEYVLTLTTAGDPGDILFQSESLAPGPGNSFLFTVFDADANDLGAVTVRLFNSAGTSGTIADAGLSPTLQFIHATTAVGTADIYNEGSDEALTTPDVEGHVFRDITAELPAFAGSNFLTYTTPGDTSAILYDTAVPLTLGTRNRFVLIGDADNVRGVESPIDRRSIETLGRFTFYHTSLNEPVVDIYVLERDAELEGAIPLFFSVATSGTPRRAQLQAGSFDVYVTSADADRTIIAGPYALDVALGDVIELIAFDVVGDPTTVDIVPIP